MTKKGYLTSMEYSAIRKTLGFSLEEAKKFHNVESVNTIKRWESGQSRVSELACNKILELWTRVNNTISESIKIYNDLPDPSATEITLIVYPKKCYKKFVVGMGDLPYSIHQTMVVRVYNDLKQLNADVGIVEFNVQDYFSFLAQHHYKDSQDVRAMWATDYRHRILYQ